MKKKYLSWEDVASKESLEERSSIIGCEEHHQMAEDVYRKGITIVKNENHLLSLRPNHDERILAVYPEQIYWMLDEKKESEFDLGDAAQEVDPTVETIRLSNPPTDTEIEHVLAKATSYKTIIIGTVTSSPCNQQHRLIQRLYEQDKQLVVVSMRSPYDIAYFPNVPVYIATYEASVPALQMAVKAIYGIENVTGKLPITLP